MYIFSKQAHTLSRKNCPERTVQLMCIQACMEYLSKLASYVCTPIYRSSNQHIVVSIKLLYTHTSSQYKHNYGKLHSTITLILRHESKFYIKIKFLFLTILCALCVLCAQYFQKLWTFFSSKPTYTLSRKKGPETRTVQLMHTGMQQSIYARQLS